MWFSFTERQIRGNRRTTNCRPRNSNSQGPLGFSLSLQSGFKQKPTKLRGWQGEHFWPALPTSFPSAFYIILVSFRYELQQADYGTTVDIGIKAGRDQKSELWGCTYFLLEMQEEPRLHVLVSFKTKIKADNAWKNLTFSGRLLTLSGE